MFFYSINILCNIPSFTFGIFLTSIFAGQFIQRRNGICCRIKECWSCRGMEFSIYMIHGINCLYYSGFISIFPGAQSIWLFCCMLVPMLWSAASRCNSWVGVETQHHGLCHAIPYPGNYPHHILLSCFLLSIQVSSKSSFNVVT